jgi:hypothetical protein
MPANPYHDPDWAEIYRVSLAAAEQWQIASDAIAAQEGFGSPRHRAALAGLHQSRAAAQTARRGEHKTLAEYAEWRFTGLALDWAPDFEAFTSLDQVHAALAQAEAARLEESWLDEVSLPVRQPEGLTAFADKTQIVWSPRRFEAAEMGAGQGISAETYLDCIVSMHELDSMLHFCIAHRWGGLSPQSRDQFRNIATVLARQAIGFMNPEAAAIFGARDARPDQRLLVREINAQASRFRFYRHVLPRRELREQFGRVDMAWTGVKYIDPDFSAALYSSIPEALRTAAQGEESGRFSEEKLRKRLL